MFWTIILPFNLAVLILAAMVAFFTVFAPTFKWSRRKAFAITTVLAVVAFIPSVAAIMSIVDSYRFGLFHYKAFSDVKDWRVERYLPTTAQSITVEKYAQGHRAKYSISEPDLLEFLDELWDKYGERSRMSRDDLHSDSHVTEDQHKQFGDLGWPVLENAIELHSPVKSNWAGATYYFDRDTGTAYHRAGYW